MTSSVKRKLALVYIEIIVAILTNANEHVTYLRSVFTLLRDAAITIKLKTCSFFGEMINQLGHVTGQRRLELPETTAEAVCERKEFTNQLELRSLLGRYNVLRRLVPKFLRVAAPLNKKITKRPAHVTPLS